MGEGEKQEKKEPKERRLSLYARVLIAAGCVWGVFFSLSFIKSFDDWYVNNIFPVIHGVVSRIFNVFPFAAGEVIMYLGAVTVIVTIIWSVVFGIFKLVRRIRMKPAKISCIYRTYMKVILVVAVYFLWTYLFHWWIPYNGHVMGEPAAEERRGYTIEEYRYVWNLIAVKFRDSQKAVPRDENGRIIYPDKKTAYEAVVRSMRKLSERYPRLKGYYGTPKAAGCSDVLEWMWIAGYTYPYTMEITYNKYTSDLYWYVLIAHETAHYKGFYKENEGEFMGMLAAVLSDDPIMVYAGCEDSYYFLRAALMNALVDQYGMKDGLQIYRQICQEDAELMPDEDLAYRDEMDANEAAEEAYAADSHPLEQYSDTAADAADVGWDTQEAVSGGNYYDDGTRLFMEYFLRERANGR